MRYSKGKRKNTTRCQTGKIKCTYFTTLLCNIIDDKIKATGDKNETILPHSKGKSKTTTRCQTGKIKMYLFHYAIMQHYR